MEKLFISEVNIYNVSDAFVWNPYNYWILSASPYKNNQIDDSNLWHAIFILNSIWPCTLSCFQQWLTKEGLKHLKHLLNHI